MTGTCDAPVVRQLLQPIAGLLQNPTLYEVVINRPGEVLAEGTAGWSRFDVAELTFDRLMRLARAVASHSHQAIDEARPILSATLPDDERIQIVIPPATTRGTVSITIRKPSSMSLSLSGLDAAGLFAVTAPADDRPDNADRRLSQLYKAGNYAAFLKQSVLARKNIIISGATGSGKTTLSKALIQHIPTFERIITIEDTAELVIPQPNHVRLYYSKGEQGLAKIGPKELLESSLRMRPDRVLLQELRDGTAFYYIRNINSGHPGSITTVHADSAALAFEQLTLLVKESDGGQDLARDDIRSLLKMLVDVVIQCKRVEGKFRVTEIWSSRSA
ncbi:MULTISPECIES: P-type DNA transfer ATPase VirB11 [unclassified Ensifer]|uniref:P-type DNA transfer ATPase VirB11 n=1 Tax=unclassified Ensifer TaxID=2633371 RepID=UPI0008136D1D|nr:MULTISPECIES: P-type DNA transfer ATPase VirB11 [unclassified Ensifer]OCP21396.1 P-type DNA transfer ATPase VirB11 [Ensifer sp. LC54]OCP26869.1 P-type DNA transfer ATPase VirB11 [Ensifer sp. LC384]